MSSTTPPIRSLILVPALLTGGVTVLRLVLELLGAPAWLASNEAGGGGAVLGISWLPPIFGIYFAMRLAPTLAGGAFWRRLARTLWMYGLAARIPVIVITILALLGSWDTHFEKFPPEMADMSTAGKIGMTFFAQLVFWATAWTILTGMLGALVNRVLTGRRAVTESGSQA